MSSSEILHDNPHPHWTNNSLNSSNWSGPTGSGCKVSIISVYGKGNLADCSSPRWRSFPRVSKRILLCDFNHRRVL